MLKISDTKIAQESSPGLSHRFLVHEGEIMVESRHKKVEVWGNVLFMI